jgi:3',5'-nucleoside bisphosphate phosphatase
MTEAGATRPAARGVDLHMHSTASDGTVAPAAVVTAARDAHLGTIALTDHDTTNGVHDAQAAGASLGVEVIPGVELSAFENEIETHILGLHLSRLEVIEARLAALRSGRVVRAEKIVGVLNGLGIPVTLERVIAEAGPGAVGRPHIARALVAGGWTPTIREAFEKYLGAGRPAFVPKGAFTVVEAIALIHAAGGLAVLAHPGEGGTEERLRSYAAEGLDGVEVRHPSHSPEVVARLLESTRRLGLVPSGGSDWHGAKHGPRTLGCVQVPAEWLDRQRERLRSHSARGAA